MERMARLGIRFNQFSAMSVCSPSRVSLLTGQNAARHRVTNWIDPNGDNSGPNGPADWNWAGLKPGDVTLPGLLRKAGYRTIHVGKGHIAPRGKAGEDLRAVGFDDTVGSSSIGQPGSYYGEDGYGKIKGAKANAVPGLEAYHGTKTFLTDALTLEANARVAGAVREKKPFYLQLSHYAVHSPWQWDSRYVEHYRNLDKPNSVKAFATLVEGMDKSLGEMLDHLDKLGVAVTRLWVTIRRWPVRRRCGVARGRNMKVGRASPSWRRGRRRMRTIQTSGVLRWLAGPYSGSRHRFATFFQRPWQLPE
jgi:hypothetical protein